MNFDDPYDEKDYLDDLGGAYLFAREEETFEARTPDVKSCGCLPLVIIGFPLLSQLLVLFV